MAADRCCDDMSLQRVGLGWRVEGNVLRLEKDAVCRFCGAKLAHVDRIDMRTVAETLDEGDYCDWEVDDIDRPGCRTCGGVGGGSVRCPTCNPSGD